MKYEMKHFEIEQAYGGNQSWFKDFFMKMGGCAAATACDSCINMVLNKGKKHLYPYDTTTLTKQDYIAFSNKMKPYLHPRLEGVNRLELFVEGFQNYLEDNGETNLKVQECSGKEEVEYAIACLKIQIQSEMPIPYLLLKHKNSAMLDMTWHWFLIVGYEEFEEDIYVKFATYGTYHWRSFRELWDTGYKNKGGMILLKESI